MGRFPLSAGTPGKRYALLHSRILMHQHVKNVLLALIAEHTGHPGERVGRDSLRDRWFTAEQAGAYGFVDQVLTDVAAVTPARPAAAFGPAR